MHRLGLTRWTAICSITIFCCGAGDSVSHISSNDIEQYGRSDRRPVDQEILTQSNFKDVSQERLVWLLGSIVHLWKFISPPEDLALGST